MTISSGDYVIATRGADGEQGAMPANESPVSGDYIIRVRAADGERVAVGVDHCEYAGDIGIASQCANGLRAFVGVTYPPTELLCENEQARTRSLYHTPFTPGLTCVEWLALSMNATQDSVYTDWGQAWRSWRVYGTRVQESSSRIYRPVDYTLFPGHNTGAAQAGTSSTIKLAASCTEADNAFVGYSIRTAPYSHAQIRAVSAYDSATKTATVTPNWSVNPAAGTNYTIVPGYVASALKQLVFTLGSHHTLTRYVDGAPVEGSPDDVCGSSEWEIRGYTTMAVASATDGGALWWVNVTRDWLVGNGTLIDTITLPDQMTVSISDPNEYAAFAVIPIGDELETCADYCLTDGAYMYHAFTAALYA